MSAFECQRIAHQRLRRNPLCLAHIHRPGSSLQEPVSASAARLRSLVVSLLRSVVLCEVWSEQRLARVEAI
jgi:hypothetical protein